MELIDDVLRDLERRNLRSATTEAQARAYVAAVVESERLTTALVAMEPGSQEHRRGSTALRGAARERDTLARQLGLTEEGRRRKIKGHAGPSLTIADIRRDIEAQTPTTRSSPLERTNAERLAAWLAFLGPDAAEKFVDSPDFTPLIRAVHTGRCTEAEFDEWTAMIDPDRARVIS